MNFRIEVLISSYPGAPFFRLTLMLCISLQVTGDSRSGPPIEFRGSIPSIFFAKFGLIFTKNSLNLLLITVYFQLRIHRSIWILSDLFYFILIYKIFHDLPSFSIVIFIGFQLISTVLFLCLFKIWFNLFIYALYLLSLQADDTF